jgi:hypothetical protein
MHHTEMGRVDGSRYDQAGSSQKYSVGNYQTPDLGRGVMGLSGSIPTTFRAGEWNPFIGVNAQTLALETAPFQVKGLPNCLSTF